MAFGVVGWYWKRFQGAVDGINLGIAAGIFNVNVGKLCEALMPYSPSPQNMNLGSGGGESSIL